MLSRFKLVLQRINALKGPYEHALHQHVLKNLIVNVDLINEMLVCFLKSRIGPDIKRIKHKGSHDSDVNNDDCHLLHQEHPEFLHYFPYHNEDC